jgi:hypothetical protein
MDDDELIAALAGGDDARVPDQHPRRLTARPALTRSTGASRS